jgi:organic hydroperoxide reductase OsmC/OhrA
MEPKKAYKSFRFENQLKWAGGRRAVLSAAGRPDIEATSPPEFKGEAGFWTPEDLFLASVNLCTMLTFVAFAQNKKLDFLSYESHVDGLIENVEGRYRYTEVNLCPKIEVRSPEDVERARTILADAHRACFVSNSVTSTVKLVSEISVAAQAS